MKELRLKSEPGQRLLFKNAVNEETDDGAGEPRA